MRPTALHARGRYLDHRLVEVDLIPAQITNLVAARGGVDQQLDDIAVVILAERGPQGAKLVLGGYSVAGRTGFRLVAVEHRVDLEQPLAHQPGEVAAQTAMGIDGRARTVLLGND